MKREMSVYWDARSLFRRMCYSRMKTVYLIGGTMGVGKTAVCRHLREMLCNSVFLDGDWCWDANPFQVTEETKIMVLQNICFLLNQFIHCSAYENVIFCWVMNQQAVIDHIVGNIDQSDCSLKVISLVCSAETLRARIERDVASGIRKKDSFEKSVVRIPDYAALRTQKIRTDGKSAETVADEIAALGERTRLAAECGQSGVSTGKCISASASFHATE